MYLALLGKEQKELFLELAYEISFADEDFGQEEKEAIAAYCQEMQLDFKQEKAVRPLDDIISDLSSLCDSISKKIIVFEAIGLAMVDKKYDQSERKIIERLNASFQLKTEYAEKCETVIDEYITVSDKMKQLVIG